MSKIITYIKPKFEEYKVDLYEYDNEGKLIGEKSYDHVKQIVIHSSEVRLSRQLFYESIVLIIEGNMLRVEIKNNSILYIHG